MSNLTRPFCFLILTFGLQISSIARSQTATSPTTIPGTDTPTSTTVTTSANSTLYILIGVTAITIFLLFLACCLVWINIKRAGLDLKALDNRQASSKVPDVAERYEILPAGKPIKIEIEEGDGLSNLKTVEAAQVLVESIANPAYVSAGPDEEPPYEIVSSSTKGQTSSTQDLSVADQTYAQPDAIDNKTNNKILADGGDSSVENPKSSDPNDEGNNTAANEVDVMYAKPVPKSERPPSQPFKIEGKDDDGLSNSKIVEAALFLGESIDNPADVSAGPDEEPPYEIVSSSTKGQTSSTQDLSVADQTYAEPDAIDNKTNNKILADGGDPSVESPNSTDPNDESKNTATNETDVIYAQPVPKSERCPSQKDTSRGSCTTVHKTNHLKKEEGELRRDGDSTDLKEEEEPRGDRTSIDLGDLASTMATFPSFGTRKLSLLLNEEEETTTL
ncbi:hypothetical protein HOLleu_32729 [Holothuria leucospilota]|uniref:Uncharacterized protein n=1 Tax=Holothuria leucospilota TaxID=206669 RepID=A0A9Q1BJ42_HOLLE|nr:hypothetical protein HOLleu_32729 [Holothuria leucospilota]